MMSNWILFVVLGQFLNAIVILIDRHIVAGKKVMSPIVYTFYVSFFSFFVVVMIPFADITIPNTTTIVLSTLSAFIFVISIYFLYKSLQSTSPLEVVPVIGGVAALSTFFFSYLLLNEGLPNHFIAAFFILTVGMLLISHFDFTFKSFASLTISGVAFGLSSALIKLLFLHDTFANSFFWSRMANVVVAIFMLAIPTVLASLHGDHKSSPKSGKLFVVLNKVLAGLAFLFVMLAIKYGNVAIVSALSAMQYVFLLLFALLFKKQLPDYLARKNHRHEILHKFSATALIVVGFFVLFI